MAKREENFEIVNNVEKMRFEVHLDGHMAELEYRLKRNKYYIIHTGVPEELGGRGIAQALALHALRYGENNGLETIVYCPYVKAFLKRHPDWRDMK
jgi:hypothetical protein